MNLQFVFVTGELGQGKTLACVVQIEEHLKKGLPVITNLDLKLEKMLGPYNKTANVIRIPDKPTLEDFQLIPPAIEEGSNADEFATYNEDEFGLCVLDECGDWFNSHTWNDAGRLALNSELRHIRKKAWNVRMIVQDLSIVDKQARESLAAGVAVCTRTDNLSIPILTTLFKLLGFSLRPPMAHVARIENKKGLFLDRWVFRGKHLYTSYNTRQIFNADYPYAGPYCLLTPWLSHGRYMVPRNWRFYMRMTKIYWKRLNAPIGFVLGGLSVLAIYIIFILMSRIELPALPMLEDYSYYDSLKVTGFQRYPNKIVYQFLDENEISLTSADLINRGFSILPITNTSARILKDENYDAVLTR